VFRIATRCKIATDWRARLLQTNLSERQPETHWQLPQYELVAATVIGCSCGITGIAFDFAVRKGKSGGRDGHWACVPGKDSWRRSGVGTCSADVGHEDMSSQP
jgi:hypothetical protein